MVVLLCFSEKERVSGSPGWPEEKDINGSKCSGGGVCKELWQLVDWEGFSWKWTRM